MFKQLHKKVDKKTNNKNELLEDLKHNFNKRFLKQSLVIDDLESKIDTLQKEINMLSHHGNYEKILKGENVRIAILFQVPSFWPSIESVYNNLLKDSRFTLKLYLIDMPEKEPSQMKNARKFLNSNNIEYEVLTTERITNFKPHVAIMQTPYDEWHRPEEFYSDQFRKMGIRLIYIPYGIEFSGEQESLKLQFDTDFINNMWRIYTISSITQKYYCMYSKLSLDEVKVFGHPKFDGLFNKECLTKYDFKSKAKGRKIVLVKIHFPKIFNQGTLNEIITPSSLIYVNLINNLDKFKDCYFIFMYHPKMFDSKELPGVAMLEGLLKNNTKDNLAVFSDEDYREPLYDADMFICDRSSVAIEMAIFDKPILFLENNEFKEEYLPEFNQLFSSYEKGEDYQDISSFIEKSLDGKDDHKNLRNENIRKIIKYYDGKSYQRIIDDIYLSIKEESK